VLAPALVIFNMFAALPLRLISRFYQQG
jgi:hypothetical protein